MAASGIWVAFQETNNAGKKVEVVRGVFSSELIALRFAIKHEIKAGYAPFGTDLAAAPIAPAAPGAGHEGNRGPVSAKAPARKP